MTVKFSSNICINEDFTTPSCIDAVGQVLNDKCSISNELIKKMTQGPYVNSFSYDDVKDRYSVFRINVKNCEILEVVAVG